MSNLTSYILALLCLWLAVYSWQSSTQEFTEVVAPVVEEKRIADPVILHYAEGDCQTFNNFTSCTNMAGCTWGDNRYCSGSFGK